MLLVHYMHTTDISTVCSLPAVMWSVVSVLLECHPPRTFHNLAEKRTAIVRQVTQMNYARSSQALGKHGHNENYLVTDLEKRFSW